MNRALLDYIAASPTAFHAVAQTGEMLKQAGYIHLNESSTWKLEAGKGYYVTRNGSSLISFRIPQDEYRGFMMTASHCDSPCFKIKENAELSDEHYVRLSVEKYGGMLCASWMDRPLAIAGRVTVRTESGFETRLVDLKDVTVMIPNVAIHMNRQANDGMKYNPAVDMLPLYGTKADKGTLRSRVAACAGVEEKDIITTDLFVYNPDAGKQWSGYVSAPRLDDLQCAFTALTAFLQAEESASVPVYCLFDNEEVGSQTKQGAASTFLADVLARIAGSDDALRRHVADSFLISCDNAHAVHPNHPEYMDKNHAVYMNEGVVIKYNASQRYATDGLSDALFRSVCERAGAKVQSYYNRADLPGGSTLGSISDTRVSVPTVDIGLPQLAMHSANETAGAYDVDEMVKALTEFYSSSIVKKGSKVYF